MFRRACEKRCKHLVVAVMLTIAAVTAARIGLVDSAQAASWAKPSDIGTVSGGVGPADLRGVDIPVPRRTTVRTVHSGGVQQVVCSSPTGTCDSDGDRYGRVRGRHVGIGHPDGPGTLHCHMVARPLVSVGQSVSTGPMIGHVGSSGQSPGPHPHFQTHDGPSTNDADTADPVAFMAARGVNLNRGGSTTPPTAPGGAKWVDEFANAPGYSTPGATRTGPLYAGRNYVYCRQWGPNVQVGSCVTGELRGVSQCQ